MNIPETTMAKGGSAPSARLLVFRVGRRRYGLPLADVRGIQRPPAAGERAAAAMFRGRELPVVDARALGLDVPGGECRQPPQTVLILGAAGRERALAVDGVDGLVDSGEWREVPALVAPFVRGVIRAVALQPEGELLIVDATALPDAATAGANAQRGPGEA